MAYRVKGQTNQSVSELQNCGVRDGVPRAYTSRGIVFDERTGARA